MPKIKNPKKIQNKLKILEKIQSAGIKSEQEFISFTPADLFNKFPDIATDELMIMCEIQCSVKENKLFSYLCND